MGGGLSVPYFDFHSHILPNMDDGATSPEQSLEMLKVAHRTGAEAVVLTPHYRTKEPIAEFCNRREACFSRLLQALKGADDIPKLFLGAEVQITGALSEDEDACRLCIEGTDVMLLELPYPTWNKWHIQEIYNMIARLNITPVMAHIERYLEKPKALSQLEPFLAIGARFQVNAGSFLRFSEKRVIKALAREGLICAIGSDCHNQTTRPADISRPLTLMAKTFGDAFLSDVYETSKALLCSDKA